ncbi:oxidase [Candidatus Marinamargulisbacteria bacterium SCGC AG-343-D04]|nr:oxidase [Candidatus Marinamargulisbacteria bacterium SCGC AG-343-D04]
MSDSHEEHSGHFIIPLKFYVMTLVALLILTVITVLVAQIDLGPLNIYVAMGVAAIKATFVILFFMGMKWEEGFNILIFIGCTAFLGLFLAFILLDGFTRTGVYSNEDEIINIKSPVKIISDTDYHNSH